MKVAWDDTLESREREREILCTALVKAVAFLVDKDVWWEKDLEKGGWSWFPMKLCGRQTANATQVVCLSDWICWKVLTTRLFEVWKLSVGFFSSSVDFVKDNKELVRMIWVLSTNKKMLRLVNTNRDISFQPHMSFKERRWRCESFWSSVFPRKKQGVLHNSGLWLWSSLWCQVIPKWATDLVNVWVWGCLSVSAKSTFFLISNQKRLGQREMHTQTFYQQK